MDNLNTPPLASPPLLKFLPSVFLTLRLARRELRGSLSRFRVFLIALLLGVMAIGAVGSIADSMRYGIAKNSRIIFGGDIVASNSQQPLPDELLAVMDSYGTTSSSISLRTMLSTNSGLSTSSSNESRRRLVNLRAVDDLWPLVGEAEFNPPLDRATAFSPVDGRPSIIANTSLMRFLGVEAGDIVRLGDIEVTVKAALVHEPDRRLGFDQFAPTVLISIDDLPKTGLQVPGALLRYRENLLLPDPAADRTVLAQLESMDINSRIRIEHHHDGSAGFENFLDRTETFLTLVSLTSLLIGGLGVSSAVRAWLASRMPILATLKSLGAPSTLIFWVYFIQVLCLAAIGIVPGIILAMLAPFLAKFLIGTLIPVPIEVQIFAIPLLIAGGFGFLTAIAFSLWPLGKARDVKAGDLFRTLVAAPSGLPKWRYLTALVLSLIGLVLLTWLATTSPSLALYFFGGTLLSLAALALLGEAIIRLFVFLPKPRWIAFRLASSALVRTGNSTRSVIVTFGLGLAVLVSIALAEFNMTRQIDSRLADDAPSWFFVDIQPSQRAEFLSITNNLVAASNTEMVPMFRGRVIALGGVSASEIKAPSSEEWILSGDRGLTWSAVRPAHNPIVSGQWWPEDYTGDLQVSMDDEAMRAFGLSIGDTASFNIGGEEVTARITSSRSVEWQSFGLNFVFIFSPGLFDSLPQNWPHNWPHNWVATVSADDADTEAAIDRAIAAAMPNVSSISVSAAVATVRQILSLVSTAIQLTAGMTLIAGFSVLAGTVAATEARRLQSSLILKVLGATRRVIIVSYLLEYGLLGLMTSLAAIGLGTLAAYALMVGFLGSSFVFSAQIAIFIAVGGSLASMGLGLLGAWHALGRKPASQMLRD